MSNPTARLAILGGAIFAAAMIYIIEIAVTRRRTGRLRPRGSDHTRDSALSLPCQGVAADGSLSRERTVSLPANSIVLFVWPRSVLSFRITETLQRLMNTESCEVAWTWAVLGNVDDAKRWLADFGLSDRVAWCRQRLITLPLEPPVPTAMYIGSDGLAAHVGSVHDDVALAKFVAACRDPKLTRWFLAVVKSEGEKRRAS